MSYIEQTFNNTKEYFTYYSDATTLNINGKGMLLYSKETLSNGDVFIYLACVSKQKSTLTKERIVGGTIRETIRTNYQIGNFFFASSSIGYTRYYVYNRFINTISLSGVIEIPLNTMRDTDLLLAYLNEPANPTFDLDVYTQGTTNPLISLVWSNLQNPVEGVNYYITVGLNKALPPQSYDFVNWIDSTSFDSGSVTVSFEDAREIGVAFPIGQTGDFRVVFKAQLFHYDDRGIRIFDDEKIVNVSSKGEISGDDVTPHEQTSVEDDDNYNEETNTYINPHGGTEETLDNLLTTSYVLTRSELLALKNFLWSADYHDNVYLLNNSPIENIISIKTIPFSVASNTSVTLKIGNVVATGVTGKTTNDTHKFVLPTVTVPKKYNNFLDYYKTSVSVYLPFIGVHDLPTNIVMGKKLRFTYIFDIVTGACAVEIAVGSGTNLSPIDYVMGNCAIDLPISAQNRTQVEIAQQKIRNSGVANAVSGVASTIGNLISGNIGGAISSGATATANAMNNYLDYSTQEYHTTTKGVIGSQLINFIPNECYLIIDRPIYTRPSTYAHDFGYPCELSLTLGNLTGYTQVSHSIELSGIPCTEQEREELRSLLIGGVYL